ncbi:MAG TPA: PAS domain-containing protein [Rhodocyclaceae bacterium]|nr:PAS domain-containing protein [Rhodocyclaceae bacterium]
MNDTAQHAKSILVIEDEPGDFELIRTYMRLSALNRNIVPESLHWEKTLHAGIAAARRHRPDIILLDLLLPDSSGLATVQTLHAALPDIPIIVLTGQDDDRLADAALQIGAQDYLIKGQFEHDALGRAIRHAIVRAKLEQGLAQSQQRIELALYGADLGLWDWNVTNGETAFNPRWCEILGFAADEVAATLDSWKTRIHPDDLPACQAALDGHLLGKLSGFESEHRLLHKDGRWIWASVRGRAVQRDAEGHPCRVTGTLLDISGRKNWERLLINYQITLEQKVIDRTRQLHAMAMELSMTEDRERRTIAQELHDDLCQILAVAKLKLTALELPEACEPRRESTQPLKEIEELLDKASNSVRSLSLQLSPPLLHQFGLISALEWLAEEMQKLHGLTVRVYGDETSLPSNDALNGSLFRIVRELLNNVVKHAGVGEADVSITLEEEHLVVTVADAGQGFDAHHELAPSAQGGYGLFSVRERIGFIGGKMHIDSRLGEGTVVEMSIPLNIISDGDPNDTTGAG